MFQLRKKRPPFGTAQEPLWEYTYGEQVKVVNGLCDVQTEAARDYLLKTGYEEIVNDSVDEDARAEDGSGEAVPVGVTRNGVVHDKVETKARHQQAKVKRRR